MRYRSAEIIEYREMWNLVDGDVDHYFRSPGLECAVRKGARELIKNMKSGGPIEKTCELVDWNNKNNVVRINAEFRGEKPTWTAYYLTPANNGSCSLTQSIVGHDLRSEWFGVKVPGIMGGTIAMSFDSEDGEKTIRGDRNQVAKTLRQNGYQVSCHFPFMQWRSDF